MNTTSTKKIFSGKGLDNRKYFAAYTNMALLNFENNIRHIAALTSSMVTCIIRQKPKGVSAVRGEKKSGDDNKVETRVGYIMDSLLNVEKVRLADLLTRHFPVLKVINPEQDCKQVVEILCMLYDVLERVRNEFTHYNPEPRDTRYENNVISWNYAVMAEAAKVIKERFKPSVLSATEKTNKDTIYDAVYDVFQGEDRKERKTIIDDQGKDKNVFLDREDYYYRQMIIDKIDDKYHYLSDMGCLFLTCLFLEKKYITLFFDGVKPYPEGYGPMKKKAVLEVFSAFRIRLAKEKYDTTLLDYALALDMLNELRRCPRELFDTFSDADKEKFRVDITSDNPDAVQDDGVTVQDGKVLFIRNSDRFPYFALRYLDNMKVFDDIRFQTDVGMYRFKFYDKQLIGEAEGTTSVRVLQKEIHGFGRLDEIELARKQQYASLFKLPVTVDDDEDGRMELPADTAFSTPYMTDSKARYVINDNRVGFVFNNPDGVHDAILDAEQLYLPTVERNGCCLSGKEVKLHAPMAWLSVYELPALIFYHHLYKEHQGDKYGMPTAEALLKSYVNQYYRLFDDIQKGKRCPIDEYAPLSERSIPEKLLLWLKGEQPTPDFDHKAREVIEGMKEETEKLLERFKTANTICHPDEDEDKEKTPAKKKAKDKRRHMDIRSGRLAQDLMKDMLFFQPSTDGGQNKLTGANYASVQAALALSSMSKAELVTMFRKAHLIADGETGHPFLGKALYACAEKEGRVSTTDLFENYFNAKVRYLGGLLSANDLSAVPFLHADRLKWQKRDDAYIRALAARYGEDDKGVQLPRGMFTQRIKDLLKKIKLDVEDYDSVSNLIPYYFYEIRKDGCQEFYDSERAFKRNYKYFDTIYESRNAKKQLVNHFYSVDELENKICLKGTKRRCQKDEIAYLNKKRVEDTNDIQRKHRDYSNEKVEKAVAKLYAEKKQKLHRLFKEYNDNERAIRRFKVQDMLVWLMAHDILFGHEGIDKEAVRQTKLCDIMPLSKNTIMELEVPFLVTLTVSVKLHPYDKKSVDVKVKITQKEKIQLKRYGESFLFVSDERLKSLVQYNYNKLGLDIKRMELELDREELEKEFARYDLKRTEVQGMVHALEKRILSENACLLHKPAPDASVEEKRRYYTDHNEAIRHNFKSMINYAPNAQADLNETLNAIRNAFSHNSYQKLTYPSTSVPEIAEKAAKVFDETKNELF